MTNCHQTELPIKLVGHNMFTQHTWPKEAQKTWEGQRIMTQELQHKD